MQSSPVPYNSQDAARPTLESVDPIVGEAIERFHRCTEWESFARERFIDDIKFANADSENGYQWPNSLRQSRDVASKPSLTMNIIRQHNLMIVNEGRRQKSEIKILARGNGATVESAQCLQQLVRRILYQSEAQSAFTTAQKFQVDGGIGWWRIVTDYEDSESFDQEVFIRRVWDPLSVYLDPDIETTTGEDARFGFVFDVMPRKEFDQAYPDYAGRADLAPLGASSTLDDDILVEDHIRVCEYFRRVPRKDELISFIDPRDGVRRTVRRSQLVKEMESEVIDHPLTRIREMTEDVVEWFLIAGEMIIDKTIWPGKYIPLIRVVGEEVIIGGILDRKGHTRNMKDAQRMYNYNAALSIDTLIPTPDGWTTAGELSTGDLVFGSDGRVVPIAEALPIRWDEECFEIAFSNGDRVVTDAGHIWEVEERGKRTSTTYQWEVKTISTAELVANKHFILLGEPLVLQEESLLVDPYVLGVWLGDGHSANGRISCHVDDAEEEGNLIRETGYSVGDIHSHVGNGCVFNINGLKEDLRQLGVLGRKAVPIAYLRGSRDQRLALLQGLMDTDGHFASLTNQCVFVNKELHLANAVVELCSSLGIKSTVKIQSPHFAEDYYCAETYRVQFTADPDVPVFRLKRKAILQTSGRTTHWRRTRRVGIVSIKAVESVPVRCISLDTPSHTFLCGRTMIPTHNSAQVEFVALQSKTPWIAAAKAIEGNEALWASANLQNHAVLVWNHVDDNNPEKDIPPPMRQEPPSSGPAYEAGMQTAFNQMMMTSGQWQNQMGMMGNERTGKAIAERQQQSDTATYHYYDNYAEALRYTGKQLIDLIPKVYDTQRIVHALADDGVDQEVQIDPAARMAYLQQQGQNQEIARRIFNPRLGKYEIAAEVGPAYATERQETVDAMTLILTQAPALTGIIGDLLLKAMSFKEAQEAAQRLKRMVPPQALGLPAQTPQEQELQMQVQQLSQLLQEALERSGKAEVKLLGKEQMRDIDVYKAETDRLKALLPKGLQPDEGGGEESGIREVLQKLIDESLHTSLLPIIEKNLGQEEEFPTSAVGGFSPPAHLGAQQANDGNWYVMDPTRRGRYLRIGPRGQ